MTRHVRCRRQADVSDRQRGRRVGRISCTSKGRAERSLQRAQLINRRSRRNYGWRVRRRKQPPHSWRFTLARPRIVDQWPLQMAAVPDSSGHHTFAGSEASPVTTNEREAGEADQHHRPGRRLGYGDGDVVCTLTENPCSRRRQNSECARLGLARQP